MKLITSDVQALNFSDSHCPLRMFKANPNCSFSCLGELTGSTSSTTAPSLQTVTRSLRATLVVQSQPRRRHVCARRRHIRDCFGAVPTRTLLTVAEAITPCRTVKIPTIPNLWVCIP